MDVFFFLNLESAKDHAETCPATPAYAPTSTDSTDISQMFNAWKKWSMADLDIFALGKTFHEIVCDRGSALNHPFKHDFWAIQERLLRPNQNLQQAGLGLSGRRWMRNQFPKKPQKSQVHRNTNHTNRIHPTHQAIAFRR